jgi:hypothetical protein
VPHPRGTTGRKNLLHVKRLQVLERAILLDQRMSLVAMTRPRIPTRPPTPVAISAPASRIATCCSGVTA